MAQGTRPRVAVIGTGGTIQSLGKDSLDLYEYGSNNGVLDAAQLVDQVQELASIAEIIPFASWTKASTAVTPSDWLVLNDQIHRVVAENPGLSGVVVTHGTATLEETAYFLNLALKVEIPVVVTGAQRPFSALSGDARLNLVNAVRVAADPASRGQGVLVVLNDEINAAREVTKTSTYRLEAFRTPDLGMLGYADPDAVVYYRRSTRRHYPETEFDVRGLAALPRVDIVYAYAGADGAAVEAALAAGAQAIVLACFAPAGTSREQSVVLIAAMERGVPVVQAARVGSGRVLAGAALRRQGFVVADNLNPQKARVLTMLGVSAGMESEGLQRLFCEY
ncbi:MAG TPA: asparaginase [Thermomicrobiaceae bacterium]|nr:asparaginase [Thermomicrobiaceae bacterium]